MKELQPLIGTRYITIEGIAYEFPPKGEVTKEFIDAVATNIVQKRESERMGKEVFFFVDTHGVSKKGAFKMMESVVNDEEYKLKIKEEIEKISTLLEKRVLELDKV